MTFGVLEIAMIGIIAAVWFGYISKEQWNKGRNKIKEVVGEVKELEYEFRSDVDEVEQKVKEKKSKNEQDKISGETIIDNDNLHS